MAIKMTKYKGGTKEIVDPRDIKNGTKQKKQQEEDDKRNMEYQLNYVKNRSKIGTGDSIDDPSEEITLSRLKADVAKGGKGENLLKSNGGGKPNMQKNRKKGSTTTTAYGEEVKKYEKGTKGIKMSKKGKC